MKSIILFGIAIFMLHTNIARAQWTVYSQANSPISNNAGVEHICYDQESDKMFVFSKDTSYHMYEFTRQNGWVSYPQYDGMLDEINMIYDTKVRNNILWCLTSSGLKNYTNGNWTHIDYKPGHPAAHHGVLAIDKENGIWFTGDQAGTGITHYANNGAWSHYNTITHPAFKLDFGLNDIKLDETAQVLWIGANCMNEHGGVYSYNILQNEFTQYDNINPKYGCIHTVEPARNKVFVGTSNFSSVRILENDSVFSQSLDEPKVTWTTKMRLDPLDSEAVWLITDVGLMYFRDTINFQLFTHHNSELDGFMIELAAEKLTDDSARVWIGTTAGLFSYAYHEVKTGVEDLQDFETGKVEVFPNPSKGVFTINGKGLKTIGVTDLAGRHIEIPAVHVAENMRLDLSGHPQGIYFLTLITDKGSISRKLILAE